MKGKKVTINGKDFDEHIVVTSTQEAIIREGIPTDEEIVLQEELKSKREELSNLQHWIDIRKNIPDSAMSSEQITERNDKYDRLLELLE